MKNIKNMKMHKNRAADSRAQWHGACLAMQGPDVDSQYRKKKEKKGKYAKVTVVFIAVKISH